MRRLRWVCRGMMYGTSGKASLMAQGDENRSINARLPIYPSMIFFSLYTLTEMRPYQRPVSIGFLGIYTPFAKTTIASPKPESPLTCLLHDESTHTFHTFSEINSTAHQPINVAVHLPDEDSAHAMLIIPTPLKQPGPAAGGMPR